MRMNILACICLIFSNSIYAYEVGDRPPPEKNNVWFEYNESDTVFIFVHGFLSDSRDAWYFSGDNNNPESYWPALVADESFGRPSIFLGGFYTNKLSGDYTIRNAAEELYSYLSVSQPPSSAPALAKKNIIFIAHSLGGIAVRHLLTKKREAFDE